MIGFDKEVLLTHKVEIKTKTFPMIMDIRV